MWVYIAYVCVYMPIYIYISCQIQIQIARFISSLHTLAPAASQQPANPEKIQKRHGHAYLSSEICPNGVRLCKLAGILQDGGPTVSTQTGVVQDKANLSRTFSTRFHLCASLPWDLVQALIEKAGTSTRDASMLPWHARTVLQGC